MAKIGLIGIGNEPGNAAKVFARLAQARVVVNDIVQTEVSDAKANLSFTINISDLDAAKKVAEESFTPTKIPDAPIFISVIVTVSAKIGQ